MSDQNRCAFLRLFAGILFAAMFVLAGCGAGEVPDPHYPYGSFSRTTVATMTGQTPLQSATTFQAGVVGQVEVGGKTYDEYVLGHDIPSDGVLDQNTPGPSLFVSGLGTNTVKLGGFNGEFGLTGIADSPLTLNMSPPVGEPQTFSAGGTITTTSDPVGNYATVNGTYTLVQENVTVSTTNLGSVSGCRHFQGSVSLSGAALPPVVTNSPISVEIWDHPSLGIVDVKSPELGLNLGQEGQNGWVGPDGNGVAVGRMMTVLDGTQLTASISTYDRAGALDADMCVHCKMLAEVRWANESDALNLGAPDPTLFAAEFQGGFGQFCWGGCPLVESPVSIFHPEDNGKGYKFFYAYVSQALKNEYVEGGDKGSAYTILFSTSGSLPPIRVTARIAYALASDSSDCSR
jgi:hypothetical protein